MKLVPTKTPGLYRVPPPWPDASDESDVMNTVGAVYVYHGFYLVLWEGGDICIRPQEVGMEEVRWASSPHLQDPDVPPPECDIWVFQGHRLTDDRKTGCYLCVTPAKPLWAAMAMVDRTLELQLGRPIN